MKLCLLNVAPGQKGDPFVERLMTIWGQNFNLVKSPDTEITSRFTTWGIYGMHGFFYHCIDFLNQQAVYQAARAAERDGFDAVLITCFGDPHIHHIRQAVNIPVASIGEASLFTAAMMGDKFGIVHVSEYNLYEAKQKIHEYGLSDRLAGICAIDETSDEQGEAIFNTAHTIEAFKKAGRELIKKGAEVLIPACGLMSPSLRLAHGMEKEYPNGLTEVDGVPVLDVMSCGILMAEKMYKLKKAGSAWISRKNLYAQPTPEAYESGKMVLDDPRITFWDAPVK